MANIIDKIRVNGVDYTIAPPDSDTKNTAGATDNQNTLYLIGARTQSDNPTTYSDKNVCVTGKTLTIYRDAEVGDRIEVGGSSQQIHAYRNNTLFDRTVDQLINFAPQGSTDNRSPYISFNADYGNTGDAQLFVYPDYASIRNLKVMMKGIGWKRVFFGTRPDSADVSVGDIWIDTTT